MRFVILAALALLAVSCFVEQAVAAGQVRPPSAVIVGEVRVCNAPGRCMTRTFQVSAFSRTGHLVARAATYGANNRFRLLVPPGRYSLLGNSNGLRCTSSAIAVADRTVTANVTCLVP
jgi:hypothetical protein